MDFNALSARAVNQGYVPFSSGSASALPALRPEGDTTFDTLLKAAQKPKPPEADAAASAPGDSPAPFRDGGPGAKTSIDKNDKLYELCMELETFLIKNLIKSMRSTVQKTGLIDTGFAGEVYEDMLFDEYAKAFSQNANFGFAEMAYRDLTDTNG